MKKLLTLSLLLFGVFALSACGGDDPDEALVQEALDAIIITGKDEVKADLTLPTGSRNETTVVWTSGNTAIVADDGTVTRPLLGEGNATVTLTASITLGDVTLTRDIDVRVMEEEFYVNYTDVSDLYDATSLTEYVGFEGVVVAMFSGGYFLSDGTDNIGIYASSAGIEGIAIGDSVYVKGTYANYYSLYQISNLTVETIVSSGNTITVTPVEKTVAEVLALDSTDKLIHGDILTVTGVLTDIADGEYSNLFLVDGEDQVMIYYYSLATSLEALEDFIGDNISIEVVYYTKHGSNGVLLAFDGLAADVTPIVLTDEDIANNLLGAIDLGDIDHVVENMDLPTNDGITWSSSDEAVISGLGVVVTPSIDPVTVTLTASVTVGTDTVTKDFVVTVLDPSTLVTYTVTESLAIADGESILVTGVVSAFNLDYGLFIQDADGTAIYVKSVFGDDDVQVGDSIVVRGTTHTYDGYGDDQRVLEDPILVEDNDGEHTVFIITDQTAAQIVAGYELDPNNSSQTFTADLVFITTNSYGYAFFSGLLVGAGDDLDDPMDNISFKIADFMPNLETEYEIGETISDVTFTIYDYNFDNVRVTAVSAPEFSDAEKVAYAGAAITLPATTTGNVTLPLVKVDYDATITWASNNETAITTLGVVTRPAADTGDVVVTLTATVNVNGVTDTFTFDVTVIDEATPITPYSEIFFSEYIEGDGSSVDRAFEIFNPTASAITLTGYTIDYYHNGDALEDGIYGQLDLSTYTIGAGDVLVFCNASFTASSECDEVFDYDTNNIVYTTGDDALALVKDAVIIDMIGVIGERPATGWVAGTGFTMDYTIVRDPSVNMPNDVWTPSEWIALPANTVSGAGSHTITPA